GRIIGAPSWTAKAFDAAGNSTPSAAVVLTVNIDTVAPTVSITSPAATTYTAAQTVTITATASDNVGVTRVEFYDGTTLKSTATTAPYTFAWAFTGTDNGAHSWTAKAYDAAGNKIGRASVRQTVKIPAVAPTCSNT